MPHTGHSGGTARCGGSGSACPAEPPALALLRALSTAWQGHCGPGERAGGDIEPSPAGGVHSSETAGETGKRGPSGWNRPQHLPRRGDTRAALAHHKIPRAGRDPQGSPAEDALRWVKASTPPGHPPRAPTQGTPPGQSRRRAWVLQPGGTVRWKTSAELPLPSGDKGCHCCATLPVGARGWHRG